MYTVNFILKNCTSALSFSFKAHKAAEDLFRKAQNSIPGIKLEAEDDYEQVAFIDMSCIAAVTKGEISKDCDRQGEQNLIQARATMKANNLAKNDMSLNALSKGNGLVS